MRLVVEEPVPCTTVRLATSIVTVSEAVSVSARAKRWPVVWFVTTGLIHGPVIVIVGLAGAVPLFVTVADPPEPPENCTPPPPAAKSMGNVTPPEVGKVI